MEYVPFGAWLREYRSRNDLTRGELAQLIGCSVATIRKIESGERRPSKQVAALLAEKLELSPEESRSLVEYARRLPLPVTPIQKVEGSREASEQGNTSPAPNNLRSPLTSLIGRQREVTALRHYLQETSARLLTLVGPPGVGKTRLGLELAHDLLPHYADGVFFVPLAQVTDPSLVLSAIARVVGLEGPVGGDLLESLSGHLSEKRMLLILDNFEQVVEAGSEVLELVERCRHLKTLITSREALHVRGEQQFVVPPLDPPQLHAPLTVAGVAASPAVTLFVERAQAADPHFTLDDGNAQAVAGICAQLEGLPLAIELVAARVKVLPPDILLARMMQLGNASRQLTLLTGGPHDSPARHRTLREAIGWSYNLLSEHEKALFARLSIFSEGCTMPAIEAICNPRGDLGASVFEPVASLLDKSLLGRGHSAAAAAGASGPVDQAEPRFTMLETIREFAAEQLALRGEAEITRQLHAQYFLAMAQAADPQLTGAEQKMWLDRLEHDHDNLRAALEWSLDQRDLQTAAQLGVALKRFWEVHNHYAEGRRWLGEILSASGELSATSPTPGAEQSSSISTQLKAKVLNAAGALAIAQSDYDEAFSLLQKSLDLQRELGDDQGVASTLNNLGMAALSVGMNERAAPLFEEGLAILRKLGDRARMATMLGNFAVVVGQLGDMERAAQLLNESLALRRELGNKWGVAAALGNLAEVLRSQGTYGAARAVYEEAIGLLRELGDKVGVGKTLVGFAAISLSEERPERAAKLLGVTDNLLKTTGAALAVSDLQEYTSLVEDVRRALDEDSLEAAWRAGGALSLDEAIDYAVGLDYPVTSDQ